MQSTSRAFTIVELLIVIVVIAILAAISIVAYTGIQERAKVSSVVSDLRAAEKAFQLYKVATGGAELPLENDPTLLAGGGATIQSIITRNAEFRNFLQTPLTTDGFQATTIWQYDNDGDTYGGCAHSSSGANLYLPITVNNHDFAQKVDDAIDDGNLACGKFRRQSPSIAAYLYSLDR
jgi:prepilin-type N-terminal cleavage/methylation domain-containing protein